MVRGRFLGLLKSHTCTYIQHRADVARACFLEIESFRSLTFLGQGFFLSLWNVTKSSCVVEFTSLFIRLCLQMGRKCQIRLTVSHQDNATLYIEGKREDSGRRDDREYAVCANLYNSTSAGSYGVSFLQFVNRMLRRTPSPKQPQLSGTSRPPRRRDLLLLEPCPSFDCVAA